MPYQSINYRKLDNFEKELYGKINECINNKLKDDTYTFNFTKYPFVNKLLTKWSVYVNDSYNMSTYHGPLSCLYQCRDMYIYDFINRSRGYIVGNIDLRVLTQWELVYHVLYIHENNLYDSVIHPNGYKTVIYNNQHNIN
jgi:hypothetical protein